MDSRFRGNDGKNLIIEYNNQGMARTCNRKNNFRKGLFQSRFLRGNRTARIHGRIGRRHHASGRGGEGGMKVAPKIRVCALAASILVACATGGYDNMSAEEDMVGKFKYRIGFDRVVEPGGAVLGRGRQMAPSGTGRRKVEAGIHGRGTPRRRGRGRMDFQKGKGNHPAPSLRIQFGKRARPKTLDRHRLCHHDGGHSVQENRTSHRDPLRRPARRRGQDLHLGFSAISAST